MGEAVATRKLIVLGTISDYGGDSRRVYRQSVARALRSADHVLVVGARANSLLSHFASCEAGALACAQFEHLHGAAHWMHQHARAGDLVLLKGSNQSDHLARLALADEPDVGCWRTSCRRGIFCDRCRLIREPAVS